MQNIELIVTLLLTALKETVKNPDSKAKAKKFVKKAFDQIVALYPEFLE